MGRKKGVSRRGATSFAIAVAEAMAIEKAMAVDECRAGSRILYLSAQSIEGLPLFAK